MILIMKEYKKNEARVYQPRLFQRKSGQILILLLLLLLSWGLPEPPAGWFSVLLLLFWAVPGKG